MSVYLDRLAKACFRHRIVVLVAWLLVAAGAIALAQASGGETDDNFTIPGTESQEAADVLADTLPEANYGSTQLVLATAGRVKVTDPAVAAAIKETLAELAKGGDLASNSRDQQELSVLCLQVLQSALVHVNTLMVQDVLIDDAWANRLTVAGRRGLNPLFWAHVAPYGEVGLNMTRRLSLSS